MASKKKSKKSKPSAKPRKPPAAKHKKKKKKGKESGKVTVVGMLTSDFLTKIRELFIGSAPQPAWPGPLPAAMPKAIQEAPEALKALMDFLLAGTPLPVGAPGSALSLVNLAVADKGWPKSSAKIPAEWNKVTPAGVDLSAVFRRYEVACVVNIMLEAYNRTGGGGGGPTWPPQHPA